MVKNGDIEAIEGSVRIAAKKRERTLRSPKAPRLFGIAFKMRSPCNPSLYIKFVLQALKLNPCDAALSRSRGYSFCHRGADSRVKGRRYYIIAF